ncbi:MAG: hypothetical protein K0Q49_204 [Haloplasmataceae bacterium]|jgi:uncharacterized protein with FMN-binding domain|nr:hypothetical protein [Haloplasmataceae bacterium]
MKKFGILVLLLLLNFSLAACKKEEVTTTTQPAAVRPNLAQYRFDLADDMLEAQSASVDTIASATDSSNGWIQAVERALEKAESTTVPNTFVNGTYTAESDKRQLGFEDATVVISDGEISSITLRRLNSDGSEVDYTQWAGK